MKKRIRSIISMLLVAAMIFTAFPSYADESPQAAEIATAEQAEAIAGAEAEPQTDPAPEAPEPSASEPASEASAEPAPSAQPAASEPAYQEVTEPAASAPVVEEGAGEDEVVEEYNAFDEGGIVGEQNTNEQSAENFSDNFNEIIEEALSNNKEVEIDYETGEITTTELIDFEIIDEKEVNTSDTPVTMYALRRGSEFPTTLTYDDIENQRYSKWIDRLDPTKFPQEGYDLYYALVEASDNDGISDFLIEPEKYIEPTVSTDETNTIYSFTFYEVETSTVAGVSQKEEDFVTNVKNAAFDAFDRDHPEVFWLSGATQTSKAIYEVKRTVGDVTTTTYLTKMSFVLKSVKNGTKFDVRNENYLTEESIKSGILERENAITSILGGVNTSDTYLAVKGINEWLTKHNEYNTTTEENSEGEINYPSSSRECLSALKGSTGVGGPVCEGYARAFKVLCDELSIDCTLCDGRAKEREGDKEAAHMWNYVHVDGNWYGMDVTWNDPLGGATGANSGFEGTNWSLMGSGTKQQDDGYTFIQSHPISNVASEGGTAFTNGPKLNEKSYATQSKTPYIRATGLKSTYECGETITKGDLDIRVFDGNGVEISYSSDDVKVTGIDTLPDIPGNRKVKIVYRYTENEEEKTVTFEKNIKYLKNLNNNNVTITLSSSKVDYSGKEQKLKPVVKVRYGDSDEITLREGAHYTLAWENNIGPSKENDDAKVIVSGCGEYTGEKELTFTIVRRLYNITYELNGGTNNTANPQQYHMQETVTFLEPTKKGFTFDGWYRNADFTGAEITGIADHTLSESITLYAKWIENKYSITFDGNGATSGTMESDAINNKSYNAAAFNLPQNKFARTNYTFYGWNTAADGSGENYADKASISTGLSDINGATVILYAQWEVAEKTSGNVKWKISNTGVLTVEVTGDVASTETMPLWKDYTDDIKSAVVTGSGITSLDNLFAGCANLTSVDMSGLNAANVTSAENMFKTCDKLISVKTPVSLPTSVSAALPNTTGGFWTANKTTYAEETALPTGTGAAASKELSYFYDATNISFKEPTSVEVERSQTTYELEGKYTLEPKENVDPRVTFTSSDTNVATVNPSTGKVTFTVDLSTKKPKVGTTTITATTNSGKKATYVIKVVREALDAGSANLAEQVKALVDEILADSTILDKSIPIKMNSANKISAAALEAAKGKDVDIVLQMGEGETGYTWTINGEDITDSSVAALADLQVEVKKAIDSSISSLVDSTTEKKNGWIPLQISLKHSGNFGFTGTLSIKVAGTSDKDKSWVLYYYNESKNPKTLDKTTNSGKISEEGRISAKFEHASEYITLISTTTSTDSNNSNNNSNNNNSNQNDDDDDDDDDDSSSKKSSTSTSAANTTTLTSPVTGDER